VRNVWQLCVVFEIVAELFAGAAGDAVPGAVGPLCYPHM
jgi:hypothetical protein